LQAVPASVVAGLACHHPLADKGYDFDVPLLAGDHVTDDTGTGFVHTAPGFQGKRVITGEGAKGDANEAVIAALKAAGALIARGRLTHQYPHSWRSKKPVIFRNTPQWFIALDQDIDAPGDTLRARALAAIEATRFLPPQGQTRLRSMIEQRPDWVISRQRAWGVPIAVFVRERGDGSAEILKDERVNARIAAAFEAEGADAWYKEGAALRFLAPEFDATEWTKVDDIVDVWFDSGATHSFVLEKRPELQWPASLYLEGSDQHRGWFHSSLLESCGTRGRAPYRAVLTHGFLLDEKGFKLSKSSGNAFWLADSLKEHGADILRLWVVGSDYTEDVSFGPEVLKHHTEAYRRLRNTLRYLLGNLAGFDERERVAPAAMPELERFVLHRLAELDAEARAAAASYDFHTLFTALHNFCAVDLSAFYFDVRKDALYCDPPEAPRRRAARTVLDRVFDCLARWLAPILCFTAEEAWLARHGEDAGTSVHLQLWPDVPAGWRDAALGAKWSRIRELRRVVTGAIELERAQKRLGSSLQADIELFADRDSVAALAGLDLAEICITSAGTVRAAPPPGDAFALPDVPGIGVRIRRAQGEKCQRCWRILPEVGEDAAHPDLCRRCADAVAGLGVPAAAGGG
ncbi:MAG TPA: class I tRNA ligase family protein, partial [Stellaceae bacterium]|nr:class I tRNA ligase family protein [Stellaceae bacterium]